MDNSTKIIKVKGFLEELHTLEGMNEEAFGQLKNKVTHFLGAHIGEDSYFFREIQNVRVCSWVTLTLDKESWESGTNSLKSLLENLIETLDESNAANVPNSNIFIVHGHDNEMKESVARLIEKQGLTAIILHEQPDETSTVVEKLEKYIETCCFGIVLLSPEDEGRQIGSDEKEFKKRARQNIVLELGWLFGKFSRKRVVILYKNTQDFELPSDIKGILYKDYFLDNWKYEVIKEMKNAGLPVSLDKM